MALAKKGVFFTFMALFLVIIIVALATSRDNSRYTEKSRAISARVGTMNNFIDDFNKDLDRELFIGGYRSQISMMTYIRQTQGYVSDFDTVFDEILVNGTANGTTMDLMSQDGQGAYLASWLSRINEEARKLNMEISLKINNVHVSQSTPWDILITVNATVNLTDTQGLASWQFNNLYKKELSIIGFEDPLYTVGTTDRVSNMINKTPYDQFVISGLAANLNDHLDNSYYIASNKSPSYLMRFTGNLSPSPQGIESMVNLNRINEQSLTINPRSVIDYIYFGNISTTDMCNVTQMPSWFRLDDDHKETYDVDDLNVSACP